MEVKTQSFKLSIKDNQIKNIELNIREKRDKMEKDGHKYRLDWISIEGNELLFSYSKVFGSEG